MSSYLTEIVYTPQGRLKVEVLHRALEEDPEIVEQAHLSRNRLTYRGVKR